jgi:NADPH:quinone reductase-like Zn-dependent oxidoreductase
MNSNKMKAIVFTRYGPPDNLALTEVEKPTPGANEVLIKAHATTVTVADVRVRGFRVPRSFWIPARITLGLTRPKRTILGAELAGEIKAVGADVKRFKVGDQVNAATLNSFGGYAEYKCLPEDMVIAKMPPDLSYEEAADIPIGARTALHYLRRAKIQPGQKVLVYGASGSVGTYAVQLAKYFGAEVTGVCSTANLALVHTLGANKVIDYTKEDFSSCGEVYDVVLEAVGKSSFSDCMRILRPGGFYLDVATPLPSASMLWTKLTTNKRLMLGENPAQSAEDLRFLNELAEAGKMKAVIDRRYTMDQIVDAHRYVDKGRKKGNVIIAINGQEETEMQAVT